MKINLRGTVEELMVSDILNLIPYSNGRAEASFMGWMLSAARDHESIRREIELWAHSHSGRQYVTQKQQNLNPQ